MHRRALQWRVRRNREERAAATFTDLRAARPEPSPRSSPQVEPRHAMPQLRHQATHSFVRSVRGLALALGCALAASFAGCRTAAQPVAEFAAPAPVASAVDARTPAERVLELSFADNRVMEHLRYLSKEIGPRLTGSERFNRAADWCQAQFRAWGLDAQLEKWGEFDAGFERGVEKGHIVAPLVEELTFATNAWSPGTSGPVRGRALLEPEDEAGASALAGQLANAWIVRRARAPKVRSAFDAACALEGAAGYVSRGGAGDRLVMSGDHEVELAKLPKQVRVRLLAVQYDALLARLERGDVVELEFDVEHRFTPGPVPCFNVVAELRGSEFPDEYVMVGGHLDSWDGAEGAQDNGTGVATTLEAARLITASGVKPRRTIRFLLFGGEEQGLFGSRFHVREHAAELARTSVVLVHDGGGTVLRGIVATEPMAADFARVFAPLARADARFPFQVRVLPGVEGLPNSGDSDHAPFIRAGVPGFFWEQSEEGYEHVHHTQFDTFETVDADELRQSARVVAIAALGFANLDALVDRTDMEPLPRRRMGVRLDGTTIASVTSDGRAAAAGLREGDIVLAIDGVVVADQSAIGDELQHGGPSKVVRVQRGAEVLELTLDFADGPGEAERAERARTQAARDAAAGTSPERDRR